MSFAEASNLNRRWFDRTDLFTEFGFGHYGIPRF